MTIYLVHFSLCLLLKGDFSKDDFLLIYSLTMESGPLSGVARWSVSKLNRQVACLDSTMVLTGYIEKAQCLIF